MMWKESYELGDELVDTQHKGLFEKTEKLLEIVEGADFITKKQECISAIYFLKDYAIKHFAAEEELQASLDYVDIEMHKLIHSNFINSVLLAEHKLDCSNFSLPVIKEFCGFLVAWLIYHVAGADRKIIKNEKLTYNEMAIIMSPKECFIRGIEGVFDTMLGSPARVAVSTQNIDSRNTIRISAEIAGDFKRKADFMFSKETALNLVNALTDLGLVEVDELAYSALREMAAIILNNTLPFISDIEKDKGLELLEKADKKGDFAFNTELGEIIISMRKS